MDRHHQDQQKPYNDHQTISPKKQPQANHDKSSSKRDEWSEGAVTTLLEAYESKWTLRNRAKLKGQDWEDVARHVSSRSNNTKSAKTQTQCKNKIESMKKRYRSESATAAADVASSSWPLYSRLDSLLRGGGGGGSSVNFVSTNDTKDDAVVEVARSPLNIHPVVLQPEERNSGGGGGGDHELGKENINDAIPKPTNPEPERNIDETDSINTPVEKKQTPRLIKPNAKRTNSGKDTTILMKRRRREEFREIGESIRWLAETLIRSEQERMEKMKEIEKMRTEAEAKRGEIDLKRTEIIASTQLEIARIFANMNKGSSSSGDSSTKTGRSI